MDYHCNKSVTLLELLIALVLLSVVVLGFTSIDLFSRYHILTSERRAKVQNDVSLVLEHMKKEIGKAIGDANNPAVVSATATRIEVWIDYNQNAKRDAYPDDRQIAYEFIPAQYQIRYYPDYLAPGGGSYEILSNKITSFTLFPLGVNIITNIMNVSITACWDPDGTPSACGTPDNPSVNMRAAIDMPSVSIH